MSAINYPPLYSLALAGPQLLGVDALKGAAWINAVLAAASVLGVGLAIGRLTNGAIGPTVLGALLMLTSTPILTANASVESEPLFFALLLATLLLLGGYSESGSKLALIGAALGAALACLTRYAGAALIAVGCITLLAWTSGELARRGVIAAAFGLVAALPTVVWLAVNQATLGATTGRHLAVHLPTRANLNGLSQVGNWVVPSNIAKPLAVTVLGWARGSLPTPLFMLGFGALALVVLAACVGVGFLGVRAWHVLARRPSAPERAARPWLLFIVVYPLVLVVSMTLFDATTSFDARLLAPEYVVGLVLVCVFGAGVWRRSIARTAAERWATLAVVGFAGLHLAGAGHWLSTTQRDGLGYSGRQWRASPALARVEALPQDTLVYTNVVGAVYCVTGREPDDLPLQADPLSGVADPEYQQKLARVRARLDAGNAVVVLLTTADGADRYPPADEFARSLNVRPVAAETDGVMYAAAGSALATSAR
ncbi:MAG: glycosyltransferase family 39 protein [Chloroflexi bacterium]|nr:glycosyltransferase family 39 protein [Chloroflexota bacterium]